MRPILFEWGGVAIPAWHAFYALGAIAAFFVMRLLARRYSPSLDDRFLSGLFTVAYIGGWFGARLFSVLFEDFAVSGFSEVIAALFRFGPMTFYGGAIGSFVLGTAFTLARHKLFGEVLDVAIPAGILALAVGRIGCFLNGDDYGIPAALGPGGEVPWWAVIIPVLEDDVARVPVQLISSGAAFSLVALLAFGFRRLRRGLPAGVVGYAGIALYATGRFGIEYLRGDPRGPFFADLFSPAQVVSILILGVLLAMVPFWLRSGKGVPK